MNSINTVVKRHWRLLVFIAVLVFVFVLLWLLKNVFLPFVIGFILAALLVPVIKWIDAHIPVVGKKQHFQEQKRIVIILAVFLFALAAVGVILFFSLVFIDKELFILTQESPQITTNGLMTIKQFTQKIPILSNPLIQNNIDIYLARANTALPDVLNNFLANSIKTVQTSANVILGFLIMPVFMFFILKDWDKMRDKFYASMPEWMSTHTKNIFTILNDVVVHYIRGQLLLGLVVGLCAGILLMVLRVDFVFPLAIFAGLTELVPIIGPWLGGGLAVVVTLATAPEKIVWVALGYLLIQLLENSLLVPRIQGAQMNIHPAFVIILSIAGAYFMGILGFIIILPLTMAVVNIFVYLRDCTRNGEID